MITDTRPLLRILPWLLASAAAHAVLLVNWPASDRDSKPETVQVGTLQVQLLRGVDGVAQPTQAHPAVDRAVVQAAPALVVTKAPALPRTVTAQRPPASAKPLPPATVAATTAQANASSTASTSSQTDNATDTHDTADKLDTGWSELMALLHQAIDRNKRYPQSALRMGREGSARVDFRLGPDGQIEDLNIGNSSGVHALDIAAYRAVQDIAPFPIASRYLEHTRRFQVDVVFRIN